jgi:hypothetical protein
MNPNPFINGLQISLVAVDMSTTYLEVRRNQ